MILSVSSSELSIELDLEMRSAHLAMQSDRALAASWSALMPVVQVTVDCRRFA
jgi:hypothetical protein